MDYKENDIASILREKLRKISCPFIKAIILFGSMARGEATERSDVDLLILHENYKITDPVIRRRKLYIILKKLLGEEFEEISIIDMDIKKFLKPREITPLLLNIYWDGKVVYDDTGKVNEFLEYVRKKIKESKLKRIKDGKEYYWILPKPMEKVKIL